MKRLTNNLLCCVVLAFVCTIGVELNAQSDKEVIIVEKIKDESGKVISKKILRSTEGDLTDQEIEEALKDAESIQPFGGGFDFNNFNFGDFDFFNNGSSTKPTLGVMLSFEDGQAVITDVTPGSGAEEAELMKGDIIVSMDAMVVNTIDDIKEYLSEKESGDEVLLSIIRNGQSFDRKVELRNNSFNGLFGNIKPEDFQGFGQLFNFDNGNMPLNMDSLLNQFRGGDSGSMPFQFGMPNYSDRDVEEERASLGIFIEETDEGIIISEIMEESAAEKAKLKVNDKILRIDGKDIKSFDDLAAVIKAAGKDTKVIITYERNGKTKETEAVLN